MLIVLTVGIILAVLAIYILWHAMRGKIGHSAIPAVPPPPPIRRNVGQVPPKPPPPRPERRRITDDDGFFTVSPDGIRFDPPVEFREPDNFSGSGGESGGAGASGSWSGDDNNN